MRPSLLAAAALVLSAGLAAHADTIQQFNYNGNSVQDNNTVTGTLSIDTTTGTVESISGSADGSALFITNQDGTVLFLNNYTVLFGFNTGSLVGYTGSSFDLDTEGDRYLGNVTLASSSSVTPEPSSIALLGTGLLGIAGVMRRRFRA